MKKLYILALFIGFTSCVTNTMDQETQQLIKDIQKNQLDLKQVKADLKKTTKQDEEKIEEIIAKTKEDIKKDRPEIAKQRLLGKKALEQKIKRTKNKIKNLEKDIKDYKNIITSLKKGKGKEKMPKYKTVPMPPTIQKSKKGPESFFFVDPSTVPTKSKIGPSQEEIGFWKGWTSYFGTKGQEGLDYISGFFTKAPEDVLIDLKNEFTTHKNEAKKVTRVKDRLLQTLTTENQEEVKELIKKELAKLSDINKKLAKIETSTKNEFERLTDNKQRKIKRYTNNLLTPLKQLQQDIALKITINLDDLINQKVKALPLEEKYSEFDRMASLFKKQGKIKSDIQTDSQLESEINKLPSSTSNGLGSNGLGSDFSQDELNDSDLELKKFELKL